MTVEGFEIYLCDYCKSIFFLKSDFEDAGKYIQNDIRKKEFLYKILFKLKRFFNKEK